VSLEDPQLVEFFKRHYAPDGGAEREHNATATTLGFGAIHYALVANLRPTRVLTIGSRYGYVPAAIALALKAIGAGTVDLVDANYADAADGFEVAFGGAGHWQGDAAEHFTALDLRDVLDVHVMRSSTFFERCSHRYGYIYIDGDHSYQGVRFDFEHACAILENDGIIAMHDAVVTEPAFGVRPLLDELDPEYYNCIIVPAWPGLAIVQAKRRS
jgi:predicted O-methyltransferase YrrM